MKAETDAIECLEEYLKRPKRILVDIDGVICAYDFKFLVKKYFNVDLSPREIYAYDLADVLGVSNLEIDVMFKEQVFGEPTFNEGALETLNEWRGKHEIIIYSNRVKYMGQLELERWLNRYNIPFDDLVTKWLGTYDVHIDDSPAKLMNTNSTLKLLYEQSWNVKCLDIQNKLTRVKDWQEIRGLVYLQSQV